VSGKKIARLASGFVFLLANPEFHLHLPSWRVVIRTPAEDVDKEEERETLTLKL
jgi:hypothetical protein